VSPQDGHHTVHENVIVDPQSRWFTTTLIGIAYPPLRHGSQSRRISAHCTFR
jgi:hypothetical protein